jgi:hypothetical protein
MWGISEHFYEVEVQKNKHVEYKPLAMEYNQHHTPQKQTALPKQGCSFADPKKLTRFCLYPG